MSDGERTVHHFSGFTLDSGAGLFRGGDEVPLRARSLELLAMLVGNAGRVVSKDELLGGVWHGLTVSEDSLTQCVHEARRALGDAEQKLIRTVPKRGYTFAKDALDPAPAREQTAPAQRHDDRPSIAVLPFLNLSDDSEQQFFIDGLAADLITDLSRVAGWLVVARNSSFAFRGQQLEAREIANELGVRYLVEGSARRAGGRVRVNVQLVDALASGHVWAERYDRNLDDIFAVQDEIVAKVVEALSGRLAVARRPTGRPNSIEAYDLCVRARTLTEISPQGSKEATLLLQRAIALDPRYAEPHRLLALNLLLGWMHWGEPEDPNRPMALAMAERAVAFDPDDSAAHAMLGYILAHERRFSEADAEFAVALRLNPNNADAWAILSDISTVAGRPTDAIEQINKALRLNPRPDCWYFLVLGQAQYAARQYEAAVATLRREETYRTMSRRFLAAALAQLGRIEEARREAAMFLLTSPHFTISHWIASLPFRDAATSEHFADGYRKAGLPE